MVDSDLLSNYKKEKKEWKMSQRSVGYYPNSKYPALRIISGLLKFISIITSMIMIVLFIYVFSESSGNGAAIDFWVMLPSFIIGQIAAIGVYAYGELITLFMDIERNTRN